jgi:hypothetical protein
MMGWAQWTALGIMAGAGITIGAQALLRRAFGQAGKEA